MSQLPRFHQHGLRLPLTHDLCASVEEDIRQCLQMIVTTSPGTRPLEPDFGCHLRHLLFRPVTPELLSQIRYLVTSAIERWEPRCSDVTVHLRHDPVQSLLEIQIRFSFSDRGRRQSGSLILPYSNGQLVSRAGGTLE